MTGGKKTGAIAATGQTQLGQASGRRVSSWLIQFESASFSGSVTIKSAASDTNYTAIAVGYKDMNTGTNSTSAITGNALVLVDSSGVDVQLDCTSRSAGTLNWTAIPLVG